MGRERRRLAVAACFALAMCAARAAEAATVRVAPGASLQTLVDRHPPGTTFLILRGVHRQQSVRPKDGDRFVGEPGAVLNGSRLLSGFRKAGRLWVAPLPAGARAAAPHGFCLPAFPRCDRAEDLFLDGVPLRHAAAVAGVDAGSYHIDYGARRVYLGRDPAGGTVELASASAAFAGTASGVTIRKLVVEKYANPAQRGAIDASVAPGWLIEGNEVRLNHGVGIAGGPSGRVRANRVLRNGQLGVSGDGRGLLVEDNEIARNNFAGFDPGWEAGGSKFAETQDLVVRRNRVHHNRGPGLWTDIDNIRTTYEDNLVTDNDHAGIFHEISYDAVIRGNTVLRNGRAFDVWLWGAQIQIAGSRNVEVVGNTVVVAADGGNGIALIQQDRDAGAYGPWLTRNVHVHDNDVTYLGAAGMSGAVADFDEAGMLAAGNRSAANRYHVRGDPVRWYWGDETDWAGFRAAGQEADGSIDARVTKRSR